MNLSCPHCGAAIAGAAANCSYCGGLLQPGSWRTARCPDCGECVSIDSECCRQCGASGPFYPADKDHALLRAIKNNDMPMVLVLLAQGVNVNRNPDMTRKTGGYTPLDAAESFGRSEIAEVLRKHGGRRAVPNQPLKPLPPQTQNMIDAVVKAACRRLRGG